MGLIIMLTNINWPNSLTLLFYQVFVSCYFRFHVFPSFALIPAAMCWRFKRTIELFLTSQTIFCYIHNGTKFMI